MKKFGTSKEWLWDVEKFIDRKACMSEIYLDLRDDGKVLFKYIISNIISFLCLLFQLIFSYRSMIKDSRSLTHLLIWTLSRC